jgi:2-amino-4-hydroxy-6-hydroxymethyldihydropteridine diphosphokinase
VAEAAVAAYVALGSNLGEPRAQVAAAVLALDALPGSRVGARSADYRTPPWGPVAQPDYINAVVRLDTTLTPDELLDHLLAIEQDFGRTRDGERWGPRTLDLDLLMLGDHRRTGDRLTLPHPRIAERAFVLLPLHDLDPELFVPGQGCVRTLLGGVDTSGCQRLP